MAAYKKNIESENKGKIVYNVGIVKGIIRLAVEDVVGVAMQKTGRSSKNSDNIKVEANGGKIDVSVNVDILYGYSVRDVAFDIQQNIKHSVESMSKYKIGKIDVRVNGVIFSEEENAI